MSTLGRMWIGLGVRSRAGYGPGKTGSEHVEDETFIIVGCVLGVEASVDEPAEGFGGEFQFGGRLQRVSRGECHRVWGELRR